MKRILPGLRILGITFFYAFLICALVTSVTGVFLIWSEKDGESGWETYRTFLSSFLLMVVTGLLVTGTRSMVGVAGDDR